MRSDCIRSHLCVCICFFRILSKAIALSMTSLFLISFTISEIVIFCLSRLWNKVILKFNRMVLNNIKYSFVISQKPKQAHCNVILGIAIGQGHKHSYLLWKVDFISGVGGTSQDFYSSDYMTWVYYMQIFVAKLENFYDRNHQSCFYEIL